MIKKLVTIMLATCLALSMASSAFATFQDLELIRVYYERTTGTVELATDLGNVKTLISSGGNIPGSFGTVGTPENLYAAYFAIDRNTNELWVSGNTTTAPVAVGTLGFNTAKSGTTNMYTYYNSLGIGTVSSLQSYAGSYRKSLSASQGAISNAINTATRINTEANLAALLDSTATSVTQNLYHFPNANTANSTGVPKAIITTNADGSTTISPPKVLQNIGVITFSPNALNVGGTTTVSATATSGLTVTFSSTTPDVCSVNGNTVSAAPSAVVDNTCTIAADQAGNDVYYESGQKKADISVSAAAIPLAPTATSIAETDITDTTATLHGTVTANNASTTVTFQYGPDNSYGTTVPAPPISLAADAIDSPVLTSISGLTCSSAYHFRVVAVNSVGATNGGDLTFTTAKCPQSITFTPPASATYGDAPINLSATGGASGNPITFTVANGPGTITGNTLTITGAGPITVKASQAGDNNFAAAPDVPATITVLPKALTITPNNTSRAYGANNPANPGFSASGLVGTDSITSVTYTYAAAANATADAGTTHSITPSVAQFGSGSASNFSITYTDGTLTVTSAGQTITFTPPASATYGDAPINLSATGGASGNPITFTVANGPGTITGSTLTITGAGPITVMASQAGNTNYSSASDVSKTITVSPKPLTITNNDASRAFGNANPVNPGFTAPGLVGSDSISSVTYTYATSATTTAALGSTHSITPSTAQFGTGSATNYSITYLPGTLTIAGTASQTIIFTPPSIATYGDGTITLSASADSSLPVSFTLVSGPATLNNNQLNITGVGTITVTARQTGNSNFAAAPEVTPTITVLPKALIITANSASRAYGNANPINPGFSAAGLVGSDSISSVTYTYAATATLAANAGTTHAITPSAAQFGTGINTNYSIIYEAGTLTVTSAGQTIDAITFTPAILSLGGTTTVKATATSGLAVTFSTTTPAVCSVSGTTITDIIAGTCTIAANQAGDSNYNPASQLTQNITVTSTGQTIGAITFTPATLSIGGTTTASATATSGLAVTFSSLTPSVCTASGTTVTGITAGTCTIAADQAGDANYNPATQVTQNITAGKVGQTISTINFNTTTLSVGGNTTASATATSGLPVSFSSLTPSVCNVSGTTVTGVSSGTCTIAVDQAGNANYNAASRITQNITVVIPPITFTVIPTVIDAIGGSIDPATSQTVNSGATTSFKLNPSPNYQIATVTGCGGTLSGNTYTTGVINGKCAVIAEFVAKQLKGDMDGKDGVTVADALLALKIAVGLIQATPEQIAAAPIGFTHGKIDIADAVAILQKSVGLLNW